MVSSRVFLDFSVDGAPLGRVIFELFNVSAPKTCENFRALCTGERGISPLSQKALYYKNSIIHRSIRDFMIQGGDFTKGTGHGGESIYGTAFADEDLSRPIDESGLLCMANKGPNTNNSQFFITLRPCPHLNGKHVVFGRVLRGFDDVVAKIAALPTGEKDRPTVPVVIHNCGELELRKPPPKPVARAQSESASSSKSESDEERGRKSTRRKRSRSRSAPSRSRSRSRSRSPALSDASDEKSRKKRDKRSKHDKEKKKSKKRKHRRSSSPDKDGEDAASKPPHEETEEEYDARLEREENERIEAARQRELEAIKQRYAEDERRREREGSSEGGIRYKGRGRMKYVDPEMVSTRQGY